MQSLPFVIYNGYNRQATLLTVLQQYLTKMNNKQVNKLYNSQNISIRKAIRELDMNMVHSGSTYKPSDVSILVVGPSGAGKSSLLKTIFYALNGSLAYTIQSKPVNNAVIEKYEIKRNKKYAVQGLSKVKETDQKLGIAAYVIKCPNQHKNPIEKYSKAVQIIGGRTLGCIGPVGCNATINYVYICLSMVQKISREELVGLKFFISELEDKRIRYTIIGTQLDKILGSEAPQSDLSMQLEQEKAIYMENWKQFIIEQAHNKSKSQVYCMESYKSFKKQQFQNSEMVNYYALNLLQQSIKQAELVDRQRLMQKKMSVCGGGSKMLWFCS